MNITGTFPYKSETTSLSIISATLNEGDNINAFLDLVLGSVEKYCAVEVIIVDDGSTDGTKDKLVERAGSDVRVIPIFNRERKGLLMSNLQGMSVAKGDYKVVMDSDLQHPPEELPRIIENLVRGHEIVICSRYVKGGAVGRRNGLRGLISRVATLLGRVALRNNSSVQDNVSGYFGFRKDMWVPQLAGQKGCKTLLHLLAENPHAKISEIPYEFRLRNSGQSKIVSDWKFIPNFMIELLSVARVSSRTKRKYSSSYTNVGADYADIVATKE